MQLPTPAPFNCFNVIKTIFIYFSNSLRKLNENFHSEYFYFMNSHIENNSYNIAYKQDFQKCLYDTQFLDSLIDMTESLIFFFFAD